jgi:hypothetical protein
MQNPNGLQFDVMTKHVDNYAYIHGEYLLSDITDEGVWTVRAWPGAANEDYISQVGEIKLFCNHRSFLAILDGQLCCT